MALHPEFPTSPYASLDPDHRWFPADEALRATSYEKLIPPLVAKVRREVADWRAAGYVEKHPPTTFAGLASVFIEYKAPA